ncbi:acetolactate synthase small subunit 2 [Pyrus ussuriensis x Pyrus communis]|uniref:Acetolactate synthase small subunit 2 n=1 Tax=Pyrus ussuriensis x Pyrus communis TaxID=2448454 RepID=A0A5N5I9K9_9ROSA|nr:acetolactate synthase small subunit 2 [Pyrus ussuriensis x Pyrus communis]
MLEKTTSRDRSSGPEKDTAESARKKEEKFLKKTEEEEAAAAEPHRKRRRKVLGEDPDKRDPKRI